MEKTAFVTPQGLYEFKMMMPFVLTMFLQSSQLMQVLVGMNPDGGDDLVTAYIDFILVFSAKTTCYICRK